MHEGAEIIIIDKNIIATELGRFIPRVERGTIKEFDRANKHNVSNTTDIASIVQRRRDEF